MVCSGALGFILLFLLYPALGVENLQTIIKYLHGTYGVESQYAMGINVAAKYCRENAVLDRHFLAWDHDAERVKINMNAADCIYSGNRLIGARPKPIDGKKHKYHSEYLLLICSMSERLKHLDPLMQTLLYKDRKGCTVFFTLNSPCVNTCSTPNGPYSIIPALEMFQNHTGPKAFVFRQVWKHDVNKSAWEKNIIEINKRIPVYRCDNNGCVRCVDSNNVVDSKCK